MTRDVLRNSMAALRRWIHRQTTAAHIQASTPGGMAALRRWMHRQTPDVIRNNIATLRGRRQLRRRNRPTPMTPGEAKIMAVIMLILCGLIVYGCGPEAVCIARGGDPAVNAFGMEWCELDGDGRPSGGDYRLGW